MKIRLHATALPILPEYRQPYRLSVPSTFSKFGVARFQTNKETTSFSENTRHFRQRLVYRRPEIDCFKSCDSIKRSFFIRQGTDISLLYETSLSKSLHCTFGRMKHFLLTGLCRRCFLSGINSIDVSNSHHRHSLYQEHSNSAAIPLASCHD